MVLDVSPIWLLWTICKLHFQNVLNDKWLYSLQFWHDMSRLVETIGNWRWNNISNCMCVCVCVCTLIIKIYIIWIFSVPIIVNLHFILILFWFPFTFRFEHLGLRYVCVLTTFHLYILMNMYHFISCIYLILPKCVRVVSCLLFNNFP